MKEMFEVRELSVGYGKKQIVSDVSFAISSGELCCILGPNGCGKTTLFRGILGANAWARGQCYVNAIDILKVAPKNRARNIALLPQQVQVLSGMTVEDVIEMGFYARLSMFSRPTKDMYIQMNSVIESVGITHLCRRYYEELSEGQKQLVLFARTLLQDTPVIFMDEPDSALDFVHKHEMFYRLQDLVKKERKAGLLVLHDPSLALTYCDRVFLMKEGEMIGEIQPGSETKEQIEEKLSILYGSVIVQKNEEVIQVWRERMSC